MQEPLEVEENMGNPGAGWEGDESLEEIDVESQGDGQNDEVASQEELNRSVSGNEQVSDVVERPLIQNEMPAQA